MTTDKIYDTLLYTMNKRYKRKSYINGWKRKRYNYMEKYTKDEQHYRENKCIYVAYAMRKTIIYYETIEGICYVVFWRWLNKIPLDMNDINEIVVNTLLRVKNNLSSALVFERDCKIEDTLISVKYKGEFDKI